MDATDIAIMKQRIKVEDMQNQLQDLVRTLRTREKEMLDWIEVRDRRRDEAIKIAIQNWAAAKIQVRNINPHIASRYKVQMATFPVEP